jgi:hypothetical protein
MAVATGRRVSPQYSWCGSSGHATGVWSPVLPDFIAPLHEVIKVLVVLWIYHNQDVSGNFLEKHYLDDIIQRVWL